MSVKSSPTKTGTRPANGGSCRNSSIAARLLAAPPFNSMTQWPGCNCACCGRRIRACSSASRGSLELRRLAEVQGDAAALVLEQQRGMACGEAPQLRARRREVLARESRVVVVAERIAPLGSVNARRREAERAEEPVDVIEGASAHERKAAFEAPRQTPEQGGKTGGDFDGLRRRCYVDQRAVDIEEQRRVVPRNRR